MASVFELNISDEMDQRAQALSHAAVVQVPIDSIDIGKRRREKLGPLEMLARSIAMHGLIHPIVLRGNTLIAGHRRLEACRSLEWKTIPARQVDALPDDELRAIELQENFARRPLSDYESSNDRLAQIRQAEADLRAKAEAQVERPKGALPEPPSNKAPRAHRRTGGKPEGRPRAAKPTKEAIAEATGIDTTTQREIERQVAIADRYPFIKRWPGWLRHHVLDAGELLDRLPQGDRAGIAAMFDQPALPPANVLSYLQNAVGMSAARRADILQRAESDDPFIRRTALTDLAQVPPPVDPGLMALGEAARNCERAAKTCRSAKFKDRIAAHAATTTELLKEFEADERQTRAEAGW